MTRRANAMKVLIGVLVWGALVLSAGPAQAQSSSADADVIQRPEWAVGDWWELSDHRSGPYRFTVIVKERGYYVLVRTGPGVRGDASAAGTKLHADLGGSITKTVRPDGQVIDSDKLEWVRFPLSVGKTWSFFANTGSVKGGRTNYAFSCKAERWETIDVGGRSLRALRIGCTQRNRDSNTQSGTHVVWYAPDAKRVVKLTSDYVGGFAITVTAWGVEAPGTLPTVASEPATPPSVTPPVAAPPVVPPPAAAFPARPAVSPTPRAERPTYKVGDTWTRSDGAYELTRIDRDVYVFTAGAGKEFHLTKDLGVARIVLDGRAVLDVDAPPKLAWPLEVGKWGGGRATLRTPPPRPLANFTGSINVAWRVEAYEDVPTAAGSFKAFRITQKIETLPTSFGSQVERKAREAGGRQRPLMKGEIEGTLPLSRTTR